MSVDLTQSTTELPNGVKLTWLLSWHEEEGYIFLKPLNFTTDLLGRVYIKSETPQLTDFIILCSFNDDGLRVRFRRDSTGASSGAT